MSESADSNIGIITALPVECAAMRTMIDQAHNDKHHLDDPNGYITGTVPSNTQGVPHKIALTVMPRDNNKNAAAVCVDLLRTYPRVRCVIVVGIAGGVPAVVSPERHVRLGDVVVATEGVTDYDHVRQIDGTITLRRHLQGMSTDLLRAVQQMRVNEYRGSRPWLHVLARVDGWEAYRRPSDSTDRVLVDGNVVEHPDRSLSGHASNAPKIHYAAIASGDRLLRDSLQRDDLARRHNVVAVEMEGSGIATAADLHGAHWFVVRGIADYCDNDTKSDRWHQYASIAAAAYVRALLAHCRPLTGGQPPQERVALDRMRAVNLLLAIPALSDGGTRQAIVEMLRPEIRDNIRRFSAARTDVHQILSTCLDYPNGVEELKSAIRFMTGDSHSVQQAFEAF